MYKIPFFTGLFDCELMDCHKKCVQGPGGPVCTCPVGQTLLPDGRMCSDNHPCDEWGTCSQECIATRHSYKCSCFKGYGNWTKMVSLAKALVSIINVLTEICKVRILIC